MCEPAAIFSSIDFPPLLALRGTALGARVGDSEAAAGREEVTIDADREILL